ncbi:MAG: hypothetical protein BWY53_00132 [Parcubacteria group bacterium ADurb.Bin326]|nr:MAG: hypothetical protein BWY53_00132 [Parcubacteria group bacterium ADurb.Bin326]
MAKLDQEKYSLALKKINDIYQRAMLDLERLKKQGKQIITTAKKKQDEEKISQILKNIK